VEVPLGRESPYGEPAARWGTVLILDRGLAARLSWLQADELPGSESLREIRTSGLKRGEGCHPARRDRSLSYSTVEPVRVFVDLMKGKPFENRSPARLGARVVGILDASLRSATAGGAEAV
jgi:hypothetical protein